jgi:ribosome biogenesis GTPase
LKLLDIGWNNNIEDNYRKLGIDNVLLGRIIFHSGKQYKIITTTGESIANISSSVINSITNKSDFPSVGDWVCLKKIDEFRPYNIVKIIPRINKLSRKVAGDKSEEQIIASNIDIVFIMTSVDDDFNIRRLERYLSMSNQINSKPIIIINKIDKCNILEKHIKETEQIFQNTPIIFISAKDGKNIQDVNKHIEKGKTIILLGSSGVGKSTLINQILGYSRQKVGNIREKDSKGRHITTNRELIILPKGGILIDTPGLREIQLWSSGEGIIKTFKDIDELSRQCRFRDCIHDSEPGCAINQAVKSGQLSEERLDNYKKLLREQEYLNQRRNTYERRKKDRKLGKIYRQGKIIRKYKGND